MNRLLALLVIASLPLCAGNTGSISGTVRDPTGAVIRGATITSTNTAQGTQTKASTDVKGFYSFPSLAAGRYDLEIEAPGFRPLKRTSLLVDADAALTVDLVLEAAQNLEAVTRAKPPIAGFPIPTNNYEAEYGNCSRSALQLALQFTF